MFKVGFDSFVVGFASFPVVAYVVYRFGAVLWQDIKMIAYKVWDKISGLWKSKVA